MNRPLRLGARLLAVLLFAGISGCQANNHPAAPSAAEPNPAAYLVYIGTFTGHGSKGIYLMRLAGGTLSPPELVAKAESPSFLVLHPSHHFLYTVNEVDQGAVSAFSVDPLGKLTKLNQQPSAGRGPTHVATDRSGKNVLVANYGSGSVALLPVDEDGKLQPPASIDQHLGKGSDPSRQEGPHAHCVNVDPENRYVLSADLGLDKVFVYKLDANAHTITPNDPPAVQVSPGAGPRHIAFHPSGKYVYVTNEMACTVNAFRWDGSAGQLHPFQEISTLPADFQGNKSTAEIMVHPSGNFLYVSNRGDANSIARFRIDPSDGKLTMLGTTPTKGKTPRSFGIDPGGEFLLAANQDSDNVALFRIDASTGDLTDTGVNVKVPTPVCVTFLRVR